MSEQGNGSPTPSVSVAAQAAPKKSVVKLSSLERVIFDRCRLTGDTPGTALEFDQILRDLVISYATHTCRLDVIASKLGSDVSWLQSQVAMLRAGVREREDEPRVDAPVDGWVDDQGVVHMHSRRPECGNPAGDEEDRAESQKLDSAAEMHGVQDS